MDDYKKLTRVIQYLRATTNMLLTLEADNMSIIKWWVDASYATHRDMKSHTGQVMSLGKGAVYSSSSKQKINTKSSTEAELVGVDDAMGQIIWTRNFLQSQGYSADKNIIYQDNMSAMLLENNGKLSSSKRTKHINVRYFFITDRIKNNEVEVQHCPTDDLVADYNTKPLQGMKFKQYRSQIMNLDDAPATDSARDQRSVLEKEQKKQKKAEKETNQVPESDIKTNQVRDLERKTNQVRLTDDVRTTGG